MPDMYKQHADLGKQYGEVEDMMQTTLRPVGLNINQTAEKKMGFLEDISKRLTFAQDRLIAANDKLARLNDGVFGAQPSIPQGSVGVDSPSYSAQNDIIGKFSYLSDLLADLESQLHRLESL